VELIFHGPLFSLLKVKLFSGVLRSQLGSEHINNGGFGATPPNVVVEGRSSLEATPPMKLVDWRSPRHCFFRSKGGHPHSSRPVSQMGGSGSLLASSLEQPWRLRRTKRFRPRCRRCDARFGRVLDLIAFSIRMLRFSLHKLGTNLFFPVSFGSGCKMYCVYINISGL
jgi:hypothetical protein